MTDTMLLQNHPRTGPVLDLEAVNRQWADGDALRFVQWGHDTFGDGLVLSTSFGIQSAVMLHLVTQVAPAIPVIWVDTGYLPVETYRFAEELTNRLQLNLKVYQSPLSPARMEALYGRLWEQGEVADLNRYDQIRKVEPMQRALRELGSTAWLTGLRADQTNHRRSLQRVGQQDGYYKLMPILKWNAREICRAGSSPASFLNRTARKSDCWSKNGLLSRFNACNGVVELERLGWIWPASGQSNAPNVSSSCMRGFIWYTIRR